MKTLSAPCTSRILMCVSGMSPAIVTETLYALVTQTQPFVPDEIHVVTTLEGKGQIMEKLLTPQTGHFHQLLRDYPQGQRIRFDADTVHVISQTRPVAAATNPWGPLMQSQAAQFEEVELKDITTDADNQAAADTIYRVMRELKAVPGTLLHASVAGGRKSMSFYMGHAFSLLAEPQDTLSHVLVNEPFDNYQLDFYYPPLTPVTRPYKDASGTVPVCTDQAEVKLAELSVLKLGGLLGKDWPLKAQTSFAFAVRLAQAALVPPEIRVVLEKEEKGYLELCGERVTLPPQQFTVFALCALARCHEDELPDGAALVLEDLPSALWESLGKDFNAGRLSAETRKFSPVRSKIQNALREVVGPVAAHFTIEVDGGKKKPPGTNHPLVFLNAPPACLKLVNLEGWWRQLKAVLGARVPA